MTIEELLVQVRKKEIQSFCVTDHYECTYVGDWLLENLFHPADYAYHIKNHGMTAGLELGWNGFSPLDHDFRIFDFVILSVHEWFVPITQGQRSYRAYLELVWHCVHHFDQFHVLGHLDFPRRYEERFQPFDREHFPIIEEIFRKVIEMGKGIEINTKVFGNGQEEYGLPNPDIDMLKLYHDLGGEFLTIGSDAHQPHAVGKYIRKGLALAQDIGFTRIAVHDPKSQRWEMKGISTLLG